MHGIDRFMSFKPFQQILVSRVALILLCVLIGGCSMNRVTTRATVSVIANGLPALYRETDLQLAEAALGSDIKLLEVLLESDPRNRRLLLLLSQAYAAYSLGFVEDIEPERAKMLYLRGRDYALQSLSFGRHSSTRLVELTSDELTARVDEVQKKDIEPLFWSALCWGNWIMLNLTEPQAIFDLTRVETMMRRVLELDEGYYFAGPHLFFGSVLAARPVMLGGNPAKAREHFQRGRELTGDAFLLMQYYEARFLAVQMQDEELFTTLLTNVLEAPLSILPDYGLINRIAKRKAALLLEHKDELF